MSSTSPSAPTSDSGTPNIPQVISSARQTRSASASVYSRFDFVQTPRFCAT